MNEVKWSEIMEKGLAIFKKVLDQGVTVTRPEMADLINFETALTQLIAGMKMTENKSFDEIMKMKQEFETKSRTVVHDGNKSEEL